MKRLFALFIAVLMCALSVVSCTPAGDGGDTTDAFTDSTPTETGDNVDVAEVETHEFIRGSAFAMWENTLYYVGEYEGDSTIMQLDLSDREGSGTTLCGAATEDHPFRRIDPDYTFLLIDEQATAKNSGHPVLIVATAHSDGVYGEIVSFDTLTEEVTVLKENVPWVSTFTLYRDTLYYETMMYGLHKLNRDGTGYKTMANPDNMWIQLDFVHGEKVYYHIGVGNMYACDLDLTGGKLLSDEHILEGASGDYIYGYSTVSDGFMRFDPNDLSQSEVVLEGFTMGQFYGTKFYYKDYFAEGMNSLREYDLETGEDRLLYDDGDALGDGGMKSAAAFSERYVLSYVIVWDEDDTNNEIYVTCYDLSTGEEWRLPI